MNSVILVALLILAPLLSSYKFPEKFERCHRNDPDLDTCLKVTIGNALKLMGSNGISSLNLPPIDPLEITSTEIGAGNNAVHLVQKYFDVQLLGISKCVVENAHLDMDKNILTFAILVPKLEQKAKYELDGKIMVMPIFGKGDSDLTFTNMTIGNVIALEEETKNGKSYFKIKSYTVSLNIKGAHYHFENLFNGDQQLGDNILNVINDNWSEIFDDIKSGVESTYAEVFKSLAIRLFDSVPIEKIILV